MSPISPMIFIKSAVQISLQQPLSEEWMSCPIQPSGPYTRSLDPNFREWLTPLESRRMGKILRRALVTAIEALRLSGVDCPDAVITGTGLGCIENTELFLDQLCREGEQMLKPTHFMQSTHNTISSLIAIKTRCHGYNSTYSHLVISFESALLDAFIQMQLGDISTALVTGNDELTPTYFTILRRTGYVGQPSQVTASEASVAMLLQTTAEDALCQVANVSLSHSSAHLSRLAAEADALMMGYNGTSENDCVYDQIAAALPQLPVLHYKHLFGEGYSASALGLYAAAHLLKVGTAPAFMRHDGHQSPVALGSLLFVNHTGGQSFSGVLLKRVSTP